MRGIILVYSMSQIFLIFEKKIPDFRVIRLKFPRFPLAFKRSHKYYVLYLLMCLYLVYTGTLKTFFTNTFCVEELYTFAINIF